MNFERLFRVLSYATVFCGFFSLWISGTFGIVGTSLFIGIMIASWYLEDSRWQISEWLGTALIVLAVPAYYGAYRLRLIEFNSVEAMLPGLLSRLILSLSAIKLLQKKGDRDWIFLYIMAFFEVLLAAGLSISALYLLAFVAFAFCMVCTIILFEMRKTSRSAFEKAAVKDAEPTLGKFVSIGLKRVPLTAVALIVLILLVATPLFFVIPRSGAAGIGAEPGGPSTRAGFSDTVKLGEIGKIQLNDEIVMRVRIDEDGSRRNGIRWRGTALDTFDGKQWIKSKTAKETRAQGDRDLIQVDYASGRENLIVQTVYLEPLDIPVLFALPRAVGVQGSFPALFKDAYGGLSFQPQQRDRVSYKVLSDTTLPSETELRTDVTSYDAQDGNYLLLPDNIDPRIAELTAEITGGAKNRYDAARAVERYLQTQFGYTLEQKAGGPDPLSDFLFNVREGHCEYFATAMAMMLRSQGIATRIVNGFQQGDYNETADVFVVRQRHAHAWVEVYFPGENAWVTFDPTPFAGLESGAEGDGIAAQIRSYAEALEMFWIQYFVAFDNQEQRSLFTSLRRGFVDYQTKTSTLIDDAQKVISEWWANVRGDKGFEGSVTAIGYGSAILIGVVVVILLLIWLFNLLRKSEALRRILSRFGRRRNPTIVEFYERLQRLLSERGFERQASQTPLEFAYAVGMSEAVKITEKYNRVRFGERRLSNDEADEIESWLERLKATSER